jgi:hypothetical protein
MLRLIIVALILYGIYYVGTGLRARYKVAEQESGQTSQTAAPAGKPAAVITPSAQLEGMPPQLQASLDTAEAQGPAALKRWLAAHGKYCRDPKLGDIQLDLAVALMRQNSVEARATYKEVKDRTPPGSPLKARVDSLARTFGQ